MINHNYSSIDVSLCVFILTDILTCDDSDKVTFTEEICDGTVHCPSFTDETECGKTEQIHHNSK